MSCSLTFQPVLEPRWYRTIRRPRHVGQPLVVLDIDVACLGPGRQHRVTGDTITGLGFGYDGALESQVIRQGLL
jgi:hypothetical protein